MQPRKQHLLDTAYRLFNRYGYHATGIDRILAESGVSKATLYKHFRSKEALIIAVLEQRHRQMLASMRSALEAAQGREDSAVLAIFDMLEQWFNTREFFGCNFIHASAEYAQQNAAIQALVEQHKNQVQQLILEYLPPGGKKAREKLAGEIALLMDGAIVQAQTRGDKKAAALAKTIASNLLATFA